MWNPVTKKVHVTRNFIWLNQMIVQKFVLKDDMQLLPELEASIVDLVGREMAEEEEKDAETDETQVASGSGGMVTSEEDQ